MDLILPIFIVTLLALSIFIIFTLERVLKPVAKQVKQIDSNFSDIPFISEKIKQIDNNLSGMPVITETIPELVKKITEILKTVVDKSSQKPTLKIMTWTSSFGRIHTYNWRVSQSFASTKKQDNLDEQLFKKGVSEFNKKLKRIDDHMTTCAQDSMIEAKFLFYDEILLKKNLIEKYLKHQQDLQFYTPLAGINEEHIVLKETNTSLIEMDVIGIHNSFFKILDDARESNSNCVILDNNKKENEIPVQLYMSEIPEIPTGSQIKSSSYQTLAIYAVDTTSDKEETRKLIGIYSKSRKMYEAFNTFFDLPFKNNTP